MRVALQIRGRLCADEVVFGSLSSVYGVIYIHEKVFIIFTTDETVMLDVTETVAEMRRKHSKDPVLLKSGFLLLLVHLVVE